MGKKKRNADKNSGYHKIITASHLMLYVILLIYVCTVFAGLAFLKVCIDNNDRTTAFQVYSVLASTTTVCGTATIGFYVFKAKKENEIQMSNGKYRMRLDLAKEIYKEFKGQTLDANAMQFMRTLISDDNVHFESDSESSDGNLQVPNFNVYDITKSITDNDDGLGMG